MIRKTYCDYLRLAATFAVIMLHVSGSNWYGTDVNGLEWQTFNFYDSLARWAVPVFVMISGSLFLGRDIDIKSIYSKYILRLVTAFVFWSFFYVLVAPETLKKGIVYEITTHLGAIVSGHFHMWFILMLIGLYMCIPILRKIVLEETTTRYYLSLSFIFAFLLPWILKILNDFVAYKNGTVLKMINRINANISTMGMNIVLGYAFFFVLGYFLDKADLQKKTRFLIYAAGIAGAFFTIFVDLRLAERTQQACSNYYNSFDVNVVCEAIAVHTLFKYHKFQNVKSDRIVAALSAYGFGIYLVHPFFMEMISSVFHLNTLSFDPRLSVPLISLLVLVLAFCFSVIINQIPVIKNYVV